MSYSAQYREILHSRTPLQLYKSEEIKRRNRKYFEQKSKLDARLSVKKKEDFLQKIFNKLCAEN